MCGFFIQLFGRRKIMECLAKNSLYSLLLFLCVLLYSSSHLDLHFTLLFSYSCPFNFTLILYGLLNSLLQYSILIRVDSYFYLCYKRELNHANHISFQIQTITSGMTLMLHFDARRQYVRCNCCSRKFMKTNLTNGINTRIMIW